MPDFLDTVEGPDWLHDAINSLICGDSVTAPRPFGKSVALVTPQSLYEALAEQSDEERYYNDYRHNAWLHNDRDMLRTLRQWLSDEGL